MKRFSSSDSLGSMLHSPQEEKVKDNLVYGSDFQAMLDSLDDEGSTEEGVHATAKKRRLGVDQVQALEKIFEVHNKLDPERKVQVAQELGLQPRQVAIWFQNRRARWKTKQLERDYNLLKSEYENLRISYKKVDHEKEKLVAELKEIKEKLGDESAELNLSNPRITLLSSQNGASEQCKSYFNRISTKPDMNISKKGLLSKFVVADSSEFNEVADFKDGSSDSDSSGILINEHNNNNPNSHPQFSNLSAAMCLSSSICYPQFLTQTPEMMIREQHHQQQHSGKIEEMSLFSNLEESCSIFSVDQAPNLYWYDQRS